MEEDVGVVVVGGAGHVLLWFTARSTNYLTAGHAAAGVLPPATPPVSRHQRDTTSLR